MLRLWSIVLCFATSLALMAQMPRIYTSDHDLTSSLVKSTFYDSKGYLWVVTEDGLNRYDGVQFAKYRHIEGDSTSLAHNFVNCLFEDSRGDVYVSTYYGVQKYNRGNDTFSEQVLNRETGGRAFAVSQILELSDSTVLFVGNAVSQLVFDEDGTPQLTRYNRVPEGYSNGYIVEDEDGSLWMARHRQGISHIMDNGQVKDYHVADNVDITKILIDGAGDVYACGTQGSLLKYDPHGDKFVSIAAASNLGTIRDIFSRESGEILLGTDGMGLKQYNTKDGTIVDVPISFIDNSKLKVQDVSSDQYGNLWISVYQKGVIKLPQRQSNFGYIGYKSFNEDLIGSSCVTSVLCSSDGSLWVGTDNDHLYKLSPDFKSSTHYESGDIPSVVMTLYEDRQGEILVGAWDAVPGIINPATGRFRKIDIVNDKGNPVKRVTSYAEDREGRLWIGTMGDGLFIYDKATGKYTYPEDINNKINRYVTDLHYSTLSDKMYAGTYDGLYSFDNDSVSAIARNFIVNCIKEKGGNLWIGSFDGMRQYDNDGTFIKLYNEANGLASNGVCAIQDFGNDLWISTSNGLSKLNLLKGTFTNYFVEDGLQGNEFYKNASFQDRRGRMFFCGPQGLTYFHPREIVPTRHNATIRINSFKFNDTEAKTGVLSGGRQVVDGPIEEAEVFRLGSDVHQIDIKIGLKEFLNVNDCTFLFKIDDHEWMEAPIAKGQGFDIGSGTTITLANLPSGKYQVKMKAQIGESETPERVIILDIAYPWYLTWWMKTIYALAFIALCVLGYHYYRRRQKAKEAEMLRQRQTEQREQRLQLFTNISHEIRTPMSLIISPIQSLIKNDEDQGRQRLYHTILRNSNRILRLMNELLDLRKIDNSQLKLSYYKVDLVAFVEDVYLMYLPTAENRKQQLEFHHEGFETLDVWIDPVNFDKVIMNLISNALKYSPEDSRIVIDIRTEDGMAVISVADNGIGIAPEEREHIFERYYRVEGNKAGGTGIGLHLTLLLVKLHHGTIELTANPEGKGSVFTVRIPLGDRHLSAEDKATNAEKPYEIVKANITDSIEMLEMPLQETEEGGKSRKLPSIVLAEDNDEIRHFIKAQFAARYNIMDFPNGEEALQYLLTNGADLVISDVMMPQMDGIELTRKIRSNVNCNHIPVILLSAKTMDSDIITGLENGADDYVIKPFNIEILLKKIETLLKSRRMLRNAFSGNQTQEAKVENIQTESDDERLMARIMKSVNKHLSNPDITIEDLAKDIGISRVHLHRKLKELTNQTTRDFIRNIRLRQAARILSTKKLTVAEICNIVGFKNPNNFSTVFKQTFGMSPTEYAAKHYKPDSESDETLPEIPDLPQQ